MNFQTINTSYFQVQPSNMKISFHTDMGNDPDDVLALFRILQGIQSSEIPQGSLKEIVTTLFNPVQKAGIAAKICHFMKNSETSIYPGYGSNPENPDDFIEAYPSVLIFNSQHITNWKFSWTQDEILAILCSKRQLQNSEAYGI
jgi:hypothetical protein